MRALRCNHVGPERQQHQQAIELRTPSQPAKARPEWQRSLVCLQLQCAITLDATFWALFEYQETGLCRFDTDDCTTVTSITDSCRASFMCGVMELAHQNKWDLRASYVGVRHVTAQRTAGGVCFFNFRVHELLLLAYIWMVSV